jgi:hypothetical protein
MERINILKEFHKRRLEQLNSRAQNVVPVISDIHQTGEGVMTRAQANKDNVTNPQPGPSNINSNKRHSNLDSEGVSSKKQKIETKQISRKIIEREIKRKKKIEEKKVVSILTENQPESSVSSPQWFNPTFQDLIEDIPSSPRIKIYEDSNLTLYIEKQLFQRQKVFKD